MIETILITGNRGFIGSYIEKTLSDHYNTIGLSRADGSDITDYHSLKKSESKIDVIIHTAAIASDDYETSFQTNVVGTLNLCKYAKENGIKRFILISTIFALEENDNGYFNSYGKTKKTSEEVATAYCKENGIDLTILRLAQVYDDARLGQSGQAMLYYFIDTIQTQDQITLFGRRNPLRNYIHIDYLCSVIEEVLTEKKVGTWNITEEKSHTITEIAYIIFDVLQKQPNISYLTEKPNIPSVHIPYEDRYNSDTLSSIPLIDGIKRILNHDK
ncbi:MAG: SDR family oxidoreductase [Sulfurovum sp.]|nr:SDR family oxidoreductase [Sulfurovum sp.]